MLGGALVGHVCALLPNAAPLHALTTSKAMFQRSSLLILEASFDFEVDDMFEEWEELTADDLKLAAELEAALKGDMLQRAEMEQRFLGQGEPLPLCQKQTASAAAATLAASGVIRLRAYGPEVAANLRSYVLQERLDAMGPAGKQTAMDERFSNVLTPESADGTATRWDLRLPLEPPVVAALTEMLGGESQLGKVLEEAAGGAEAELWELAALISAPGAAAQVVHSDTLAASGPGLLHTAFVALQPVSRELGPTRFLPFTHVDTAAHVRLEATGDVTGLLEDGSPPRSFVALLDTGDAAVYDGLLLHCGGANTADAADCCDGVAGGSGVASDTGDANGDGLRVLFYFTFRHASRLAEAAVHDPGRSLLPEHSGRITIGMLRALGTERAVWPPPPMSAAGISTRRAHASAQ